MGLNPILDEHRQVFGRERRRKLQHGILRSAAKQCSIVVHRRERGGKENCRRATGQCLTKQGGWVQTKKPDLQRWNRFDDGCIMVIVKFRSAPERMQMEIEREQLLPKRSRFVLSQPDLRLGK